jgi:hypothetical protein
MIAQVACYLLTTSPTATMRKPLKGEDENKVIDKDDERLIKFGWALGSPNLASSSSRDKMLVLVTEIAGEYSHVFLITRTVPR